MGVAGTRAKRMPIRGSAGQVDLHGFCGGGAIRAPGSSREIPRAANFPAGHGSERQATRSHHGASGSGVGRASGGDWRRCSSVRTACTACGKCVQACPTGALFHKGSTVAEMERDRSRLEFIVTAREKRQWIAPD